MNRFAECFLGRAISAPDAGAYLDATCGDNFELKVYLKQLLDVEE
jgi:hypothetical protein